MWPPDFFLFCRLLQLDFTNSNSLRNSCYFISDISKHFKRNSINYYPSPVCADYSPNTMEYLRMNSFFRLCPVVRCSLSCMATPHKSAENTTRFSKEDASLLRKVIIFWYKWFPSVCTEYTTCWVLFFSLLWLWRGLPALQPCPLQTRRVKSSSSEGCSPLPHVGYGQMFLYYYYSRLPWDIYFKLPSIIYLRFYCLILWLEGVERRGGGAVSYCSLFLFSLNSFKIKPW